MIQDSKVIPISGTCPITNSPATLMIRYDLIVIAKPDNTTYRAWKRVLVTD